MLENHLLPFLSSQFLQLTESVDLSISNFLLEIGRGVKRSVNTLSDCELPSAGRGEFNVGMYKEISE